MRHKWFGLSGLVALLALFPACSSTPGDDGDGTTPTDPTNPTDPTDPGDYLPVEVGEPEGQYTAPPEGQLTSGDWDDNLNFGAFQKYLAKPPTKWSAPTVADRVLITVKDGAGKPLSNASVTVANTAGTQRFAARTASDGRLAFMPTQDGAASGESFKVTVAPGTGQAGQTYSAAMTGSTWNVTLAGAASAAPTQLDVAFLLDTTGSMGEVLNYLKSEMQAMVSSVSTTFPGVSARFALVLYRDEGDLYVVRPFDFSSDVAAFRKNLDAQTASGGGDLPEAVERAMVAGNGLGWRTGNTARVVFLITDTSSHLSANDAFFKEVRTARDTGIRVYTVAAGGVSPEGEYQLRQAAQLTLGRYIFLTDDSDIGGPNAQPHIPCYQVQLLKDSLIRAIDSELAGRRLPAASSEILRSVGNPRADGSCVSKDGTVTYLSETGTSASLGR